ncbi:dopamine beta-hydroxylase, partial [Elysia marginata]
MLSFNTFYGFLACLNTLLVCGQSSDDHTPTYSLQLDPDGHFSLQWSLDYSQEMVKFQLTAKISHQSWFAVGFSDYGEVTSADLLVYWADVKGVNHLVDAHTDERGILYPDSSQGYHVTSVSAQSVEGQGYSKDSPKDHQQLDTRLLLHRIRQTWYQYKIRSGRSRRHYRQNRFKGHHGSRRHNIWYSAGKGRHRGRGQGHDPNSTTSYLKLVVNFERKFRTCDPEDYPLDNGTTHVIYMEDTLTRDTPLGHSVMSANHRVQRAQILKPEVAEPIFPEDTWTFEVRAPQ